MNKKHTALFQWKITSNHSKFRGFCALSLYLSNCCTYFISFSALYYRMCHLLLLVFANAVCLLYSSFLGMNNVFFSCRLNIQFFLSLHTVCFCIHLNLHLYRWTDTNSMCVCVCTSKDSFISRVLFNSLQKKPYPIVTAHMWLNISSHLT